MHNNYFEQGSHKALCDICSRAYKSSDLREQWDGAMVCYRCYDSKHPDLEPIIAPVQDPMVLDARPRPTTLTYVDAGSINTWGGMLYNGRDYGTEFTWDGMDISWDEATQDDFH